jgi:deazaflavin-dependent oxidoreductase (nitroreductase family)
VGAGSTYAQANPLQRAIRRAAATRPGSWVFARVLHGIDRPVSRATGGGHTFTSLVTGLPVVMLTTTGARSGLPRSVPLLGIPTGDGLVVIASNYGQAHHPAWYHNLRANPEGEVTVGGVTWRFRSRQVEGEQRARIWQQALAVYPGWSAYERRAAHRDIAVFLLEPVVGP